MAIKARPFKTLVGKVEVEGYFEGGSFVFSFYGLVAFRPPVMSMGEDAHGRFAVLQENEIRHPDGYILLVEPHYDSDLGTEWGYQVSLRRDDTEDRNLLREHLKGKGLDPESGILITPPKQLTSVFFDPHGVIDGSAYLPEEGGQQGGSEAILLVEAVRSSAARRVFFSPTRSDRCHGPIE